jgi:hypothetical protein
MNLVFNGTSFELSVVETDFTKYIINSLATSDGIIELSFNDNYLNSQKLEFDQNHQKLKNLLTEYNQQIEKNNIPSIWKFQISDTCSTSWLENVHEHWAMLTILDIYDHNRIKWKTDKPFEKGYYGHASRIVKDICGNDFSYINHMVHHSEHLSQNLAISAVIKNFNSDKINSGYQVKSSDTVFEKACINFPYYDVGRPQYEKWLLTGKLDSQEISNYINIPDTVDILSYSQSIKYDDRYINQCEENNVPAWKPNLPFANFVKNHFYVGNEILRKISDKNQGYIEL